MDYGLYLHLPYCRSLCPYCAFAKAPLHHAEPERLLASLDREWALAIEEAPLAWARFRPRTIYVGGGTPTALDPGALSAFLSWTQTIVDGAWVREWTVEANPEGLTEEKLGVLREAGVGRVSLGVQSFEPNVLRRLGRIHSADQALAAIDRIRNAGFSSISVDLMTAVPDETPEGFAGGVEVLIGLGVPHVSLYALQLEEGTALAAKAARGAFDPPGEDVAAVRYEAAGRLLAEAGYRHYEVSSWARDGFESRHNQAYWMRRPYLGLGPGAHSFDGERRWQNDGDVTRFFESLEAGRLPRIEIRSVSEAEAREETVLLGLRRARGLKRSALERAAPGVARAWEDWAERAGALRLDLPGRVRPTEHGLMTALEVVAELFARTDRPSTRAA